MEFYGASLRNALNQMDSFIGSTLELRTVDCIQLACINKGKLLCCIQMYTLSNKVEFDCFVMLPTMESIIRCWLQSWLSWYYTVRIILQDNTGFRSRNTCIHVYTTGQVSHRSTATIINFSKLPLSLHS